MTDQRDQDRAPDEIFVILTDVHLGWKDRLRVLFARTIRVRSELPVFVDGTSVRGVATSRAYVDSIFPTKRSACDFIASDPP